MEEMKLGPNGALIYCMEYLVENIEWMQDEMEALGNDEYVIFDCPGQIELYSHVPAMQQLTTELQRMGFTIAAVYLLDSQFVSDAPKFLSGVLCCLSAMTKLELPHVSVLSKCDLLPSRRKLDEFLEADALGLREKLNEGTRPEFYKLNSSICELIDEWNMVQFLPLDPNDPDSVDIILAQIDNAIQYHDDVEPKIDEEGEPDDGD